MSGICSLTCEHTICGRWQALTVCGLLVDFLWTRSGARISPTHARTVANVLWIGSPTLTMQHRQAFFLAVMFTFFLAAGQPAPGRERQLVRQVPDSSVFPPRMTHSRRTRIDNARGSVTCSRPCSSTVTCSGLALGPSERSTSAGSDDPALYLPMRGPQGYSTGRGIPCPHSLAAQAALRHRRVAADRRSS